MLRWSNRVFMLIALGLLLWVFAQERSHIFSEMKPNEMQEAPVEAPKPAAEAPASMPPQESVNVPLEQIKPAKKPVAAKLDKSEKKH